MYSAQHRAVTSRDYEAIIQSIYPNTESGSRWWRRVKSTKVWHRSDCIKPKNGTYVSDFDKQNILNKLKQYSMAGINSLLLI